MSSANIYIYISIAKNMFLLFITRHSTNDYYHKTITSQKQGSQVFNIRGDSPYGKTNSAYTENTSSNTSQIPNIFIIKAWLLYQRVSNIEKHNLNLYLFLLSRCQEVRKENIIFLSRFSQQGRVFLGLAEHTRNV